MVASGWIAATAAGTDRSGGSGDGSQRRQRGRISAVAGTGTGTDQGRDNLGFDLSLHFLGSHLFWLAKRYDRHDRGNVI